MEKTEFGYREYLLFEFSKTYISLIEKFSTYYEILSIKGKYDKNSFFLLVSIFKDLVKIFRFVSLYARERKSKFKINSQKIEESLERMKKNLDTIYLNINLYKKALKGSKKLDYKFESLKEINEFMREFDELNVMLGIFTNLVELPKAEGNSNNKKFNINLG